MLPKCVETRYRLPHEGKSIVHSFGKLETRVHHRDGYGQCHPSESSAGDRGRRHHNRRGHVRRSEGRLITLAGTIRMGASGKTSLESPSLFTGVS